MFKNKEDQRECERKWRKQNVERVREYQRQYRQEHKDEYKSYAKELRKERKQKPKQKLNDLLQDQNNPLIKPCLKCKYVNTNGIPSCDYIRYAGTHRPCPAGKKCTVRIEDAIENKLEK